MVAAVKTLTETSRTRLPNMEIVTGTVTTATTNDWIDVSTLNPPLQAPFYAHANIAATGVDAEAFCTPASNNFVVISGTGTGACQVIIFAESFESTGGD